MPRTDTEQLVVSLEARIRDFERNFKKANQTASKSFGAIENRAEQSSNKLERTMSKAASGMSNAFKGFAAGALGALAFDKIVGAMQDTAKAVAEIGNQAKRAGVSSKAFQELGFVAQQNRIPIDALTDGMKELNLRADEFISTGKGSAAEAFQRLGFSAKNLATRLKDPSALLVEIIQRLGQLDKAAQIRIADEIFGGTGGERFVELLDLGDDKIREQIQVANDLGLVLDEQMIAKADEIDKKFNLITQTVGTHLKGAIVEATYALGEFINSFREIEQQTDRNLQLKLSGIYEKIADTKALIADLETNNQLIPGSEDLNIERQTENLEDLTDQALKLRDILDRRSGFDENFVFKTGDEAKKAKPPLVDLNKALDSTGGSSKSGASGLETFADAIRALKDEIPELVDQLASLDAQTKIDGVYRQALNQARTMGEVNLANQLYGQASGALASKSAREAANKSMLDLIGYAEGTDKGRGYNETLSYGAFTGGDRNLVGMTLDQIDQLQTQMLRHPDNSFNSSALGRYQIVQKTMRGLRKTLGVSGSDYFTPEIQDRMAEQLLRQRGDNVSGLRNEWEGLRRIDPTLISQAYNGTSQQMPPIDPGVASNQQAAQDKATAQVEAYAKITQGAQQFRQEQTLEAQALGMTRQAAQALRYEQDMLNQAQQAGIVLTPQQRQELRTLAQGMAEVETATQSAAQSQQELQAAQGFLANSIGNLFTGIITGSMSAEQALQQLVAQLAQAAIQAALFGSGPLGGLFGGGAGLLGSLFGFSSGGVVAAATGGHITGPGTGKSDSIPARLSNGEFVVNAQATKRNRQLLEAINGGNVPAFADGGMVGAAPITRPTIGSGGSGRDATVNIASTVNVNASGGTPEANDDMAKKVSKAVENQTRMVVQQELRNFSRPGGASLGRR